MRIDVIVTRKIRDLVQDAAEDVLLASDAPVSGVQRGELWSFDVEGANAREVVRRVLDDTTLVVNPNVHRYTFDSWGVAPAGKARLLVRVHDDVDARGAAVLRATRDRLGERAVRGVTRSILWAIDVDGLDRGATLALGDEMTGAGAAGAGLLANRHAQEVTMEAVTS